MVNLCFQGHRINKQDENGRPFFSVTVIMYRGWFIIMVFTHFNWGGGAKRGAIWVGEHLGGNASFLPKSALVMMVGKWTKSAFCNLETDCSYARCPTPVDLMGLTENWDLKRCSIFCIDMIWPLRIFTCLVLSKALEEDATLPEINKWNKWCM